MLGVPSDLRMTLARFTSTPILMRERTLQVATTERLGYGILNENLVLLPEDVARGAAKEIENIFRLRTFGEARRFEPQYVDVPGLDDDEYDEPPDDEDIYDVTLTSVYLGEDWPPPAATFPLDDLPDDLDDIGEQIEHFPGYPTLYIDRATERDLVETLRRRGYDIRRDDELIGRLG